LNYPEASRITPTDTRGESQRQAVALDQQRKAEGRSAAYRALAPVAGIVANVPGMEESARDGDTSGVLGHAAAGVTLAATPLIAEGAVKGSRASANAIKSGVSGAAEAYASRGTSAARATIPEAANLPNKAITGAEKIYRAAAPTGGDPMFRGNLYKVAGDLAEIGRKAKEDIANAKGGIAQPDMRVRAVVDAVSEHLQEMYKQERAPQIQRNAENPVAMELSKDAKDGLKHLSRIAGTDADRSLASKALSSDHLTLAETDHLAKLVNKELTGFESMTPAERAAASQINRKTAGLKALDRSLGEKIGAELERSGEPGIKEYESRYAALSTVRDQLQSRMNAVELKQPGVLKGAVQPIARLISGGKSGVASASQAAIADVNIGRTLQQGLKHLADTKLTANRGTAKPIRPVRGLLKAGPRGTKKLGNLLGLDEK
jgi:hypothetical protein